MNKNARVLLGVTGILVALALVFLGGTPSVAFAQSPVPDAPSAIIDVSIVDFDFLPDEVTVPPGTTVRWTNNGALPHTATSTTGVFDSDLLQPGEVFEFTFTEEGTFDYFCELHPSMQGKVKVELTPSIFATHVRIVHLQGSGLLLGIIRIVDENAAPIVGATVDVNWTIPPGGGFLVPQARQTNPSGLAFPVMLANWSGTYVLDLANVTAVGYDYDPDLNLESSDTITLP